MTFGPFLGSIFGGWSGSSGNSYIPVFNRPTPTSAPIATSTPKPVSTKSTTVKKTTPKPIPTSQIETPQAQGPQTVFTRQQEIDYFIKIAITDESRNYMVIPLAKWTKANVSIRYFGTRSASDQNCADQTVATLNSLSTTTRYSITTGGLYDIDVNFVPYSQIEASRPDALGYMTPTRYANNALAHASAYVPNDYFSDSVRCHTIRHEMTHSTTGLLYNLTVPEGGYHYSIFNVAVEGWSADYLNIDKAIIKIMLNTGIQPGLNDVQARAFLQNAQW